MRNASKNTIKRIMRTAKFNRDISDLYWSTCPQIWDTYALNNFVAPQIFKLSKGKLCSDQSDGNHNFKGIEKYA